MTIDTLNDEISLAQACLRTVGERLSFLRRRTGLNLTDAASASGLSRSELSRLENDGRRLKARHMEILGGLYGIEAAVLREFVVHTPALHDADPRFLPCFDVAELDGKGVARARSACVRLPFTLDLGQDAYMIAVGDPEQMPVPARSMVVVDPAARPVLGDLAANAGSWSPVLLILRRDENGSLDRGGPAQPMRIFHKAVAVFSQSHFAVEH